MEKIKQLILEGNTTEAIRQLNTCLATNPSSDEAYYLLGNAYRKQGDVRLALNNYLTALALNPDSPARQAHDMLMNILNFYHKDLYNP